MQVFWAQKRLAWRPRLLRLPGRPVLMQPVLVPMQPVPLPTRWVPVRMQLVPLRPVPMRRLGQRLAAVPQ